MTFAVLTYQDHHFPGVESLWREAFPHDRPRNFAVNAIPRKIAIQPELFVVAVDGDQVIGSALAGYDGYRGWLNRVAVLKSHQRRGVGAALVRDVESRLETLGCAKINLQILGSNEKVAGFYRAMGYQVEDRISMGKDLT